MCDKGVGAVADKRVSKDPLVPPSMPLINGLMFTLPRLSFIIKTGAAH